MKKKILAVAIALGLITALLLPAVPVGAADPVEVGDEIVSKRGRASRTYQGANSALQTVFVGSPEFTKSIVDGSWVDYGFSEWEDCYTVQHPWSSVTFYDYYTVVYDETFTEIKVYDDRWIVEYQNKQGSWVDSSYWNVTRSYEILETGIKLYRTGATDIGQRVEEYYFRNGSPCKITIYQTCDEAQTLRFVWKPSGVVAASEKHIKVCPIDPESQTAGLNYYDADGKFTETIRWYEELDTCSIDVTTDSHAQGRKAEVTFGGFAINAGGIACLDPTTFYPDAGTGNTTVDGQVGDVSNNMTWANIVAQPGNDAGDTGDAITVGAYSDTVNNQWDHLYRGIITLDTSLLTGAVTLTGAVLTLYGNATYTGAFNPTINVYGSAPANNNALVDGDFDSVGTTAFCDTPIAEADFKIGTPGDPNAFILNSSGLAAISKTGITRLGLREAVYDVPPWSAPPWVGSQWGMIKPWASDKGAGYKPKLVVTYTVASTVTTQAVDDIEDTTATGHGTITATGNGNVDAHGICWNTGGNPDTGDTTAAGSGAGGVGAFTANLVGLPTGTTVYAKAYATNAAGTSYGGQVSFLTKPAAPTNVAATSNQEDKVTITWTKSTGATDYHVFRGAVDLGASGDVDTEDDAGATAATITNAGTVTATDGTETAHVELSLAAEATGVTEYAYTVVASNATGDSDASGANNGNRSVGAITFLWQVDDGGGYDNIVGGTTDPYNYTGAPEGSIDNAGTASASDGAVEAHVVLALAGEATTNGATYDYQCIVSASGASNSPQTSDNNDGYRGVGAITFQWYRSQTDADGAPWDLIGGGTTDPYNDVGAPASGDGRWYYCVVSSVDASNTPQDSTHDRGYRLVPLIVVTGPCSGFSLLWAIVNGEITAGTESVTHVGFDYGPTDAYGSSWTSIGSWEPGDEFWTKLSPLTPATIYHYRAKAYDGSWSYGSDKQFSTKGSPTLYEGLNTGGDEDSGTIYSANWTAEQFTSDNISHTITSIRVPLKRVGTAPGIVTLSITHADSDNFTTGADLSVAYIDGDDISTGYVWYDFDVPDITLDADSKYAIVIRATSANTTNHILWQRDSGGGIAEAVGSHSSDSGISWVSDSPADYLFEIWGETVMSVEGANVFEGYVEPGDWLFTLTYKNIYTPYYPNEDTGGYFYIQLVNDTTVVAQGNCPAWDYHPGSIYIAKSLADTLEWGSTDYKIRLYGNFGTNPYTDYVLTAADWKGSELTFLDKWVISQANAIGEEEDVTLTVDIADRGELLNDAGHVMFSIGIPELNEVRPNIFETVVLTPTVETTPGEHALQAATVWETRLGPQLVAMLDSIGDLFDLDDGRGVGGVVYFAGSLIVIATLTAMGQIIVGLCLGYIVLMAGAWVGVLDWWLIGAIAFFMAVLFFYKAFMVK